MVNPYSLPLWEYGKIVNLSTTSSVESLTYLWSFNSVSWKLCECTSNLRFLCGYSFIPYPSGGTVESSTSPRPLPWSHWRTCEVSTLYLENCANARWMNVFWVVNPLFMTPMGNGRIVNLFTICPRESLTYLWNFNSVSWKLCECTSLLRFLSD